MIHGRVFDDSGARVARRVDETSRQAACRSRPGAEVRAAGRRRESARLAAVLVVLAPALALLKLMSMLAEPEVPESALLPTLLGVAVAALVVASQMALGILWRGERAWCVRLRCCPACGYDMDGLTAREDGLTVCPECGAAWKVMEPPSG